jgi:hypothetical protein
MYFSGTIAPMFRQCGIYDEFVNIAKTVSGMTICNEQREVEYVLPLEGHQELLVPLFLFVGHFSSLGFRSQRTD